MPAAGPCTTGGGAMLDWVDGPGGFVRPAMYASSCPRACCACQTTLRSRHHPSSAHRAAEIACLALLLSEACLAHIDVLDKSQHAAILLKPGFGLRSGAEFLNPAAESCDIELYSSPSEAQVRACGRASTCAAAC